MAGRDRTAGQAPARGAGRRRQGRPEAGKPGRPPADGDLAARRTRLRAVITPVVEAAGYDLEDLVVSRAGRRHLVRVVVDGDDGVSLDEVADVSRAVSEALDADEAGRGDVIAGEYVLEVSSPGVDRPLTQPRHWRRNIGRLVAVPAGAGRVTGRITAADENRVTLSVDGMTREFGYADLGPGRVQIEFSRLDDLPDDEDPEYTDLEYDEVDGPAGEAGEEDITGEDDDDDEQEDEE
jgi:ribosome maturation factor RimP